MDQRTEKVQKALLAIQKQAWEQGVAAQAMLELGETDWVISLAREAVKKQAEDGRLAVFGDDVQVTDPAANGEAVLYAYQATGDVLFREAADKMLAYLMDKAPRNAEGIIYHLSSSRQLWVDSMYMAPPFLAAAGRPWEAVRQIEGYRKYLWDLEKKLYAHIWDDDLRGFARGAFWGVGNGWALAGMTRVLKNLPQGMEREKELLAVYIRDGVDGCLRHWRDDGLFYDVVDDPSSFVETNLAQMLSYTIYRGVSGGWLDHGYLPFAEKMRKAASAKVDKYGLVQGVCGSPTFDHPGTAAEGQAFFLLMEAAAKGA